MTQPLSLLQYSHGSGVLRPERRRGNKSHHSRGAGDLLIWCVQNPLAFTLACTHGWTAHPAFARVPGGLTALFGHQLTPALCAG